MIALDGLPALSPFRIDRLNAELARIAPGVGVLATRHVYLVDAPDGAALDLERLGEVVQADSETAAARGASLFVVPRLGTRSPWSSKATDILVDCGFPVRRIERGVAFELQGAPAPGSADWSRMVQVLHDPMTQSVVVSLDQANVFEAGDALPLGRIALGADAPSALRAANNRLGLALADDEIDYLADRYRELARDPTDAELMMFAQANSEHCRHKVFNATFMLDGVVQEKSLFAMIRNTHAVSPAHTLSAYHDNAAVVAGSMARRWFADPADGTFRGHDEDVPYAIKVETHNHPTAISPYPGASTGSGGEIRDEGATGRGGKPKAGLVGFTVSDLRIPGLARPWERARALPPRFASAFEIMRDGPLGGAAFNNEFGRPCLGGYFRAFEQPGDAPGLVRGYDKPIMIAGGLANLRAPHVDKRMLREGDAVVVLGGPAMLIGLGGGAASSVAAGSSSEQLDFASVQRDNPEMQRRCQEVIDACWARGDTNPIVSIHDVGAGGLSNAIPEILNDSGVGGRIELRSIPSDDPQLSPMQIWCNESQERYVLGVRPDDLAAFEAICTRERCPFAIVGHATTERRLVVTDAQPSALSPQPSAVIDLPLDVLFGKPPRMQRDAKRREPRIELVPDTTGITVDEALQRVLRMPAVGSKSFLVTIGDRSVGGLCSRDPMVGPWQVPVADCAVTLADFDGYAGEAMAMGERTPLALLDAAASARMAVGEALTNLASARVKLDEVRLSANWMAAVGHDGEDAALYEAVRAVGMELCPALGISIPVGKDSMSMQVRWAESAAAESISPQRILGICRCSPRFPLRGRGAGAAACGGGFQDRIPGVADRHCVRAHRRRACRPHAATGARPGRQRVMAARPRRRPQPPRWQQPAAGIQPRWRRAARSRRCAALRARVRRRAGRGRARPVAGLPRPQRRRRPGRVAGDGIRRPLRPRHPPRRLGRQPARGAVQRGAGRAAATACERSRGVRGAAARPRRGGPRAPHRQAARVDAGEAVARWREDREVGLAGPDAGLVGNQPCDATPARQPAQRG